MKLRHAWYLTSLLILPLIFGARPGSARGQQPGQPRQGGAGGSGVTVACCPKPLPTRLYYHLRNTDTLCPCLTGVYPLDYDGSAWVGAFSRCGGKDFTISLRCLNKEGFGCSGFRITTRDAGNLWLNDIPLGGSCECGTINPPVPFALAIDSGVHSTAGGPAQCCGNTGGTFVHRVLATP